MRLNPGSMAPGFTATDSGDRIISLDDLRKEGPLVLVFLRGFS